MAIVNRSLDTTEQLMAVKMEMQFEPGATLFVAGQSLLAGSVDFPVTIVAVNHVVNGISGSPLVDFFVRRATSAGVTAIAIGISGMVGSTFRVGYSGLAATGSTLLNLSAGDQLYVRTTTANAAIEKMSLSVVVQKTQDILSYA